jgi:hypothetical protein
MEPDESTALASQWQRLEPFRNAGDRGELDRPLEEYPLFVPAGGAIETSPGLVDGFPEPLELLVRHIHQFSFPMGSAIIALFGNIGSLKPRAIQEVPHVLVV